MAQYRVKQACGHITEVDLFGPGKSREKHVERMKRQECRDCVRAEQDRIAATVTKGMKLPELDGTLPQQAWARTIRGMALHTVNQTVKGIENSIFEVMTDDLATAAVRYVGWICGIESSKEFIDGRENLMDQGWVRKQLYRLVDAAN